MSRRPKPPPAPPTSARRLTENDGTEERRVHPRYELLAQLQMRVGGEVALLTVSNISAGGLLIGLGNGEHPGVRVGADVSVFLDLGDDLEGTPVTLDAAAEVVRIDLGGPGRAASIALMWTADAPAFTDQLARVLAAVRKLAGE